MNKTDKQEILQQKEFKKIIICLKGVGEIGKSGTINELICNCRSKGKPYQAVIKIAKQYGYTLITTAPYTLKRPDPKIVTQFNDPLNRIKAEHLETFI